ncbi:MAG: class I SAM-dependent methyltransferase [Candidatus Krumholzibacteriota bacterium]|nr:class I SAM-dependent methyltransferase [Candidatus Krumholzibacteriota bacterium]
MLKLPEPVIPGDIPAEKVPSLLSNWFLGSKARRYLSRRRFVTVTGLLPEVSRGRALDIGCGWGYNLFLLRSRGFATWGIDIVQNDFFAARRIADANGYSNNLLGADMSALPFDGCSFDAVTAVETFEHVFHPDRPDAVREVARVLRRGGRFVLSTPNYYSLVEAGKRLIVRLPLMKKIFPPMCYPVSDIERSDYHPYSYHRPSRYSEIRALLEEEGFEITEVKKIIFVWKSVPDLFFAPCAALEAVLERLPFLKDLASTLVVSAVKKQ